MGLIFAGLGAAGGTLADQWKELFYTDALDSKTLMVRGKIQSSRRSTNKFGHDNIITNGSGLLINDGQCAIIVDQGEIVECCSEPGYYTYDQSTEPTIFCGNLGEGIKASWDTFKKRFTYGGDTGKDQRIYFFNTKEMVDQKFGTPNPIPFRVVDNNIGLDIDVSVRVSGAYSIKLEDPILFYKNVAGNVKEEYEIEELDSQLRAEFMTALQTAIGKLSDLGIRPSQIPNHVTELIDFLNEVLSKKWRELRGFKVISMAMNPIILPEEDQKRIQDAQMATTTRTAQGAASQIAAAQADALRNAAKNEGGSVNGFMGMGLAGGGLGETVSNLFKQAEKETPKEVAGSWTCPKCGQVQTGNFCSVCGAPKPASAFCPKCGAEVKADANFCPVCGEKLK